MVVYAVRMISVALAVVDCSAVVELPVVNVGNGMSQVCTWRMFLSASMCSILVLDLDVIVGMCLCDNCLRDIGCK